VRKPFVTSVVSLLVLAALLCAPARSDEPVAKPLAVISCAGYDAMLADLACLGEIGNHPGLDKSVDAIVKMFTSGRGLVGVDTARPSGIALFPGDDKPTGYGFVPVTDLKALLEVLDGLGHKSSEAGDGLIEIDTKKQGKRLFIREGEGWAFFADQPEYLVNLPDDPSKLLSANARQYDVAVCLNIADVPAQDREKLMRGLREQAKKDLAKDKGTEAQKKLHHMMARMLLSHIGKAIEELDQITIGASLDSETKTVSLEVSVTALEGTSAAARLAQLNHSATDLAGFQLPGAAVTVGSALQCSDINTKAVAALFSAIETAAFEEIDRKVDSPKKAEGVKKFVGQLIEVVAETVAEGRLDRRMSLVLDPDGVTLVGATHVADGPKLAKALGMVVEVARKKHGDVVDEVFTPNVDVYKGVRLHVLSIPITDKCPHHEQAIALVGEKFEVVFGVADHGIGFAAGKDAMKAAKQAIDRSIAKPQQPTLPAQLSVSMQRVAAFLATVAEEKDKPGIEAAAAILKESSGKDHITAVVKPIDRGVKFQLQIEEGVLKVLGEARNLKKMK